LTDKDSSTGSSDQFIIPLSQLTKTHINRAGSKAANLGEMLGAGIPVPDGFVLTTEAFERFLGANGLGAESSQEDVENLPLPPEVEAQLQVAAEAFTSAALAVRSSGVAEDLAGASFAGQYETVLDVRGFEALSAAVRRCWGSAFSEHVSTYLAERGEGRRGSMAVLVQRLVNADAAGVAFSANPVTGDRGETVINAVRGLGEKLVSGQATPDEWVVRGQEAVSQSSSEDSITAAQALAVADLARQAEIHFGAPQDVEWAIEGGELYMLQSRPITALPEPALVQVPVPVDPPPGFWERDLAHVPYPLSPLFRTAALPAHEKGICDSMEEFSMLIEGVRFREIGGWLYQRVVPLGAKEDAPDRGPPPAWLMPLLIRLVPSIRKRVKGLVEVFRGDVAAKTVERWYDEWKPNNKARIDQFRSVDLTALSDDQLRQHLEELLAFMANNSSIHALITAADFIVADFILSNKRLLGWDEGKSLELLSGLSFRTTELTQRLGDLAHMALNRPAVRRMLDNIDHETVGNLAAVDGEFAEAFEGYLRDFGGRTLRWELNEETLEERPGLVLNLIKNQLTSDYDFESEAAELEKTRGSVLSEAREALSGRSTEDREEFEATLAKAERAYPTREDHEYYLHNAPLALLRYTFLEIGGRLAKQGILERADDIFFLELGEVRSAFGEGIDQRKTVTRRKGELEWVKAHPGPMFYGGPPPPPPSLDAFPYEVKRMMEGMMWMLEGMFATEYLQQEVSASDQSFQGVPASPGQYTGPVRIIMGEEEFHKLQAGDVLVCPTTQPPWSVLFPSVGALVTDSGGILSHPAIIAREYKVPAVVATGKATSILRDGQIVTVDGSLGRIVITHED
jgi:phosphohistidine swiveling domain-containing protein